MNNVPPSKKLKILYVTNSSKPGGVEMHVLALCKGMLKKGHEIFLWCPEGELATQALLANIKVTQITIKSDLDFGYIFNLAMFMKHNQISVLHAHEIRTVCNTLIAAILSGVKVKISHTHTPISTWKIHPLKKLLNLIANFFVVNLFSTYEIALTQSVKKQKQKEGILEKKLKIIPNGLLDENYILEPQKKDSYNKEIRTKYGIPENSFVIGNISRLSVEKGNTLLISAFAQAKIAHSVLLLAGGGPEKKKLEEQAMVEKVSQSVIFTDYFPEEEKIKLLSALDLLCFPSFTEGFGYVPLEALLVGVPVLVSDIPVLKDVLINFASYFEVGNVDSLVKKIIEIHDHNQFSKKSINEKAREFIQSSYSNDMFIKAYESLYLSKL